MRKDPTEFRERFAAYKNGKSVNEIYDAGRPLPMYAGGKASKKGAYVQGSEAVSNKRYTSSNAIRNRISKWEGAAMTQDTIDPLTGKIAKKNRPFDEVDRAFYNAIPEDIRDFVLSNQDLADGLYSYAYNVGPNRFAERVVPALRDFRSGVGSVGNVLTSMWAHGDKKLRGLANRRAIERGIVEKALSDQNPTMSRVPYANDDYNYYRANQLGYKPDNTGHLPSRDEVTGTYLKSATHPTVMHAIVGDLAEGYQPYFDKKTGRLASQTIFKIPTIKEAVESQLFQGLPGYKGGKPGWDDTEQQKAIREWGEDWKIRTTAAGRSKVLQKWAATGKKPEPESSQEYTKRRVAEETKRTWLSDAADIAAGVKEGAASMTPYTAVPYFGARVGQDVLNGNVGAQTALNAAFAAAPFMPKFVLPKLFNRTRPVADRIEKSPLENYIEKILANSNKYKIQHGTIDELFPEHANSVNDFMKYDVYPRFVDRDHGWFHDIVTDDVANIFGKNGVPKEIKLHTFFDPIGRYGGWRRGNDIYINVGTKRDVSENLIHEIEHAQRGLIAKNNVIKSWHNPDLPDNYSLPMYTNNEKSFLKRGWPMTEDFINAEQIVPINEMGATNRETRFAISRLNGGMYGKDLDAFIDKMPDRELELYLSGGNGYARNVLSNFPIFNLTKQALKYIPTVTIPLTTLRTNNTQNELRNK